MKSSLYSTFAVDTSMENEGIACNYDDVRVFIARAGGSNNAFKKSFQARIKPYRHQFDNDTLSETMSNEIMAHVYAESVILRIDTQKREAPTDEFPDGKLKVDAKGDRVWATGKLYNKEDKLVDADHENVVRLLLDLPELFTDLRFMAGKASHYRREEELSDEKNSKTS